MQQDGRCNVRTWGLSICLTPFFHSLLGLTSFIILLKKLISLTMVPMGMGKRHYFSYHSKSCNEEKYFIKDMKVEQILQSQKGIFWEKGPLSQRTFLHFMNTWHNFTLEIETSWDTRLAKCILQICMCVCMYEWPFATKRKNVAIDWKCILWKLDFEYWNHKFNILG